MPAAATPNHRALEVSELRESAELGVVDLQSEKFRAEIAQIEAQTRDSRRRSDAEVGALRLKSVIRVATFIGSAAVVIVEYLAHHF